MTCEQEDKKLLARRVMSWIFDESRKPAINAFTEGPERQIAYAVEWLISKLEKPDVTGQKR